MGDSRSLLTDDMRACVGREFRWLTSFPIGANEIRRWAIAIHWPEEPPRRHWDDEWCAANGLGTVVAPDDFNPFAWATADPPLDRPINAMRPWPEPELGLPEPPTRANILSELTVRYGEARMRPGDVIRSTTHLAGYREREGRLGLMLYTTQEERWVNQRDEHVRTSSTTVIRYR
ncbi:MAG: MaoC family dehydratase N-terminal domain-containing protein [Acidimicrobiales bacterium]